MRWMKAVFVLLSAATACLGQAAPGPIAYRHEVRQEPPLHLHIVTIDLADPRIELVALPAGPDPDGAGPWEMTLNHTTATARQHGLEVGVNANFFMTRHTIPIGGRRVPYFVGNWARAVGWLVSDGQVICRGPSGASLVVDEKGRVRIGKFDRLPPGARHVVSGSQQILRRGEIVARDVMEQMDRDQDMPAEAAAPARAPRTGAGISADGNTLVLLVVDGRLLLHSVGMSETELAREMRRLGCSDALNLDGGGSSTLVMRDPEDPTQLKLMNRPSDGHDLRFPLSLERAVACVLGVRVQHDRAAPSTVNTEKPRRP